MSGKEPVLQSPPTLIFLGGSFDPPHAAHVAMARAALERFPGASLIVLPAPRPAIADGDDKAPATTSFAHRVEMCRLAFANVEGVKDISSMEAELRSPNYTVNTLRAARQHYAGQRLGLLIGGDQLRQFARWREPMALLGIADLIIAPRGASKSETRLACEQLARTLVLSLQWNQSGDCGFLAAADGTPLRPLHVLAAELGPAASREIRASLRAGQMPPPGWLPESVQTYVKDQQLYTGSGR